MNKLIFRKMLVYITTLTLLFAIFASMSFNVAAEYQPPEPPTVEDPPLEDEHGWMTEGDGTYFEVVNSSYLNVGLTSSEDVHVLIETVPNVVSYCIESNSGASSTLVTLSGLEADKTYYLHEDGYEISSFTTDGSGSYSYTQDITTPHHVFIQESTSTIYINSDGSISPSTAPISRVGDLYTLTDNINDAGGLIIYRSGITLDGNGFTLQGSGGVYNVYGIYIGYRENIVVKNLVIDNYGAGINLYSCDNIDIIDNTITGNSWSAIRGYNPENVLIKGNTISDHNAYFGIYWYGGYNISIEGNTISNITHTIYSAEAIYCHGNPANIVVIDNVFLNNQANIDLTYVGTGVIIKNNTISTNLPGYSGGCYCLYATDVTITDNLIIGCSRGIGLAGSNDITIIGNTILNATSYGIYLFSGCYAATVMGNIITNNNDGKCIYLSYCSENVIVNSNTVSHGFNGIYIGYGADVTVTRNTVSNCTDAGIWMRGNTNSVIAFNTVTDNILGIAFWYYCSGITIKGNTISDNLLGIWLHYSNSNTFYNNSIINNTYQIQKVSSSNTWDNGTGEGNYWSDYTGLDDGSDGRIVGDGIGDTLIPHPYTDQSSGYYQLDNYPLMDQWAYVNYPPVADAGGPYAFDEGGAVTLDASGSTDPNYDLLTYRWDLDNDGSWDIDYSFDASITYSGADDYSGSIRVEVSDGEYTSISTTTLTVNNVAPSANPITTQTINEGCIVLFTGFASDPGSDDLTFTWSWGYSSPNTVTTYISNDVSPMEISDIVSHVYGDNGVYTVTLTVDDDDGASTTVSTTVTVNNVDPTAMILGGIGIADNYIFTTNWYGFSWIMDILGDGSFATPEFIDDKGAGTYGAGIGDFDNDGDLDALLGDSRNTWYYEKLGPGNNFADAVSIEYNYRGYRMDFAEADYNNDGYLDAIMANYGRNYFSVYMGNGDGTFSIGTLNGPYSIIGMDSGDFNNDGNMDFIASGYTSGPYIYMGNGDGSFQSPIILYKGTSWGVCAGDFNNDGNDDFIFAGTFYPGNGDGTFGSGISLGFFSYGIAESDINSDGNLDLVYTDYNNIIYRTGNGDGTFNYESTTWINWDVFSIAVSPESEGGGINADEGELITFNGTFTDLGWLDTHTATWNWGDGSATEDGIVTEENVEPMSTGEISGDHTYGDNAEYTVTLTVTDDDGGFGSDTITVVINNVAPIVNAGSDQNAFVGIPADFSGSFTDPGWLDTHTIEWDWGDGTPIDSGSLTPQHTFSYTGEYIVTLTVTDDDGGVGTDTIKITVYYPPVADAGIDQTVDEGDTVNFDATLSTGSSYPLITNPGFETSDFGGWTVYIPTGASANVVTTHTGSMGTIYSPIYGSYFSLLKTDGASSYTTVSQTFSINAGVTISGWAAFDARDSSSWNDNACVQVLQGGVVVATPWYSDVIIVGDFGDGPWEEWSWTATSSDSFTLEYRVANAGDSAVDSYAMFDSTITVMNYYQINSYEWDFDNDGTYDYQETPTSAPDGLFDGKTTHIYGDNNAYTVTVQITDELGATATDTCLITVNNVAPTITSLTATIDPVQLGDPITANAEFTDPGFLDTHTANIDWGDDTIDNLGTVTSPITNLSHTYNSTGVYTITLTVIDDDGDNDTMFFRYVVIYDPSAGFVTGGGWIMSPEGSYTPNPNLTGKANFGFVAKYKKGQSTPDGNTEFQFKAANMNFHSSDYQWLVIQIAGAKAMYKGNGTINGEGNYGFKLTAIDEDLTPSTDIDMFRIKIWDKDNDDQVIYDNQLGDEDDCDPSTPISGGNIKIHAG